jgi:hypothetical protein
MDKQEESELAAFWEEISQYLPKSIERAALGDEKIFRAFKGAYPKIKSYLRSKDRDTLIEKINEKKEFFMKATGGTTDSSVYSKGVLMALEDVKQIILEVYKSK